MDEFLRKASVAGDLPLTWSPKDKNIRGKALCGALSFRGTKAELRTMLVQLLIFYELELVEVDEIIAI